jgi:integrase
MANKTRKKTEYPGVVVRKAVSKATGKPETLFYIQYRDPAKKQHYEVVGSSVKGMTAAKANQIRVSRIEGKELPNKAQRELERRDKSRPTISRLFERYQDWKGEYPARQSDRSFFKHVAPLLGDKLPSEIVPLDIERLKRDGKSKGLSPQSIKHACSLVSRLCRYAEDKQICPGLGFTVKPPTFDNRKTDTLSAEQLTRLLDAIDADHDLPVKTIVKIALFTGMRKGEILGLKWSHVDFDAGFIYIKQPKGGRDQEIPLNKSTRDLLTEYRSAYVNPWPESEYVFPGQNGRRRQAVGEGANRIKRRAGLPDDFRPLHSLRHVYASMLASSGQVDMYTLQKLLTHKSPEMTQRYAHLHDDALKRAAATADDVFGQIGKRKVINIGE